MHKNLSAAFAEKFIIGLLFLGFIEFSLVAVLTLRIPPDPKSAVLFGYSLSRLVLFGLALIPAIWLLALAVFSVLRARVMQRLESVVQKKPLQAGLAVIFLTLLAFIFWMTPPALLGKYGAYFERASPLLFALCFYPAQFSLNWLLKRDWRPEQALLRSVIFSLGALLALIVFMFVTGLGLTPEQEHWNVPGNPLTGLQLASILLAGVLVFSFFGLLRQRFSVRHSRYLDLLIVLALFAGTVLLWIETPVPHNQFASRPEAPYFQSFPISDARVHDLGAIGVLKGAGILFKSYTDKPLYMVFLAILHVLAGYDYNLLSVLQTGFLALMVPFLYVLGKSFHSRLFGFVLAGIVMLRQQNAILLSDMLDFNATPTQLLTEVPTLLGLVVATCALFYWMITPGKAAWYAFVAGGILGAVSLVRLNPFLLILATPVFLFLSLRKRKKEWLFQSFAFVLGCTILIMPWVITGTDAAGGSFFVLKFKDIINVRYGPQGALPPDSLVFSPEISGPPESFVMPPLAAGLSLPPIEIHKFPGFVINHTLHNFVGAFLTLPDSIQPDDQNLDFLMRRPVWSEGQEQFALQQIPFMVLNLCLLAVGLGWSWKRWKWAGLCPLFVFVIYSLSLGLARTSGSRYLVPVDWVVDFYFALGLLCLLQWLSNPISRLLDAEPVEEFEPLLLPDQKPGWKLIGAVTLILCLAVLIPAAQKLIPPQKTLCAPVDPNGLAAFPLLKDPAQKINLVYGEVLYPEIDAEHLNFLLITCQSAIPVEIAGFTGELALGQRVIAGLSAPDPLSRLTLLALPPDSPADAQILWQRESK